MGRTPQRLDVRPPAEAPAAEMFTDQDLGNLDGVECGTLAQIVGYDPQVEPVRDGRIAPDAADINGILTGCLGRCHIPLVSAVIDHRNPRRAPQDGTRVVFTKRPLELDIDR